MNEEKKEKREFLVKRRTTPIKIRSSSVYNKKVEKITKWHDRLTLIREKPTNVNPNTKEPAKRKELKPLSEYINKIKKPSKGD